MVTIAVMMMSRCGKVCLYTGCDKAGLYFKYIEYRMLRVQPEAIRT